MGVGKSSLISQYVKKQFIQNPLPTIAIEFTTKKVIMNNGDKVKIQIWDTAGEEKYKSITSHHYKKAMGALIVYDITRRATFEDSIKWFDELKNFTDKECVICIVGNKYDIVQNNPSMRKVTKQEGETFAINHNALFFEMSAKNFEEINKCFNELIKNIYEEKKKSFKFTGKISLNDSIIGKEGTMKKDEETIGYCC